MQNEFLLSSKRILITGACGTVGAELTKQLLEENQVKELIAIDNNESGLFFLEETYKSYPQASFFLADIRDRDKLCRKMKDIDLVFHTAAFKHVSLCERSPFEAVQTNILGVQNLIYAAIECGVEKVVFTSSDKAVNPTNVMGISKLMGEKIMTAANSNLRGSGPIFVSTRFGNVLGSRGSVIPLFLEQIKRGGPVTVTDPLMTRFIMSIRDAVRLVIDSITFACGGEVFVTKMPVIRISDLAEAMIEEISESFGSNRNGIEICIVGSKPGEKISEELLSQEESRRTWELQRYYAILPAFRGLYRNIEYDYQEIITKEVSIAYNSANEPYWSKGQIKDFLHQNRLLG